VASAQQQPLYFVQLSDPQFGMYANNAGFEQETANFEFAVATVNRLKPAFVVITGDLVNKAGEPAQIAEYKRIVAKIDPSIPVYHVAGNHDVGNAPTPESLAAFRKNIGRDYYSFRNGPVYGIVLNSVLLHAPASVAADLDAQEAWLKKELVTAKASGAKHILVFQHHPFFIKDAAEPDVYENIPRDRRSKYLDLLRSYGVRYVFAGHYHQNAIVKDGDLEMITTGAVGKPLRGSRSGIRVVAVGENSVTHEFRDFGSLPEKLAPPVSAGSAARP
jgi:3',5'-cyclic AMP phosphodiesterase CpdA